MLGQTAPARCSAAADARSNRPMAADADVQTGAPGLGAARLNVPANWAADDPAELSDAAVVGLPAADGGRSSRSSSADDEPAPVPVRDRASAAVAGEPAAASLAVVFAVAIHREQSVAVPDADALAVADEPAAAGVAVTAAEPDGHLPVFRRRVVRRPCRGLGRKVRYRSQQAPPNRVRPRPISLRSNFFA